MSPELDQTNGNGALRHDRLVLEGKLALRRGERWVIVDGSQQLIGPVVGADQLAEGDHVAVGISQNGTPLIIHPGAGGGGGDVDGGFPGSTYGGDLDHVDGGPA